MEILHTTKTIRKGGWQLRNCNILLTQRGLKAFQQSQEPPWCLRNVGNPTTIIKR
jgi:hypothetical protein